MVVTGTMEFYDFPYKKYLVNVIIPTTKDFGFYALDPSGSYTPCW
jgi:hypothetical protein